MRRYLTIVLSIGSIILLLLVVIEFWVRHIPNEYSYKYKYLESHVDSIEVLCVGSSIGRSGFDPSCFSANAFNAANVSQDLLIDCALVDKYLNRAKKMRFVVFAILPNSYSSILENSKEHWRLRKYDIYMNLPGVEKQNSKDRFEISNLNRSLLQIMKYYNGRNTVDCNEKGMGLDSIVENETVKLSQGKSAALLHGSNYQPESSSANVPTIKRTISNCHSKGVKVLLVLLPTYHTYYERINRQMLFDCDSISKELEKEFPNVTYINAFKDTTYVSDDFRNSNHLSRKGARKMSLRLNNVIERL